MELDKELYNEIKEYCKLNELKVGEFINNLLKKAFMVEKYGVAPPFKKEGKKPQEEKKETEVKENTEKTYTFVETKKRKLN